MANEKLIVADVDERSVRVLDVGLRTEGYRVTTAVDGRQVLARIESDVPELLLCATALPGIDGFALVEKLKEQSRWATIPVLFLTGKNTLEERIRSLVLGVDDCLAKPVLVREVVSRVRLLLDRRRLNHLAAGTTVDGRTRLTGSTQDIGVVDLLQSFEGSRRGGVLHLQSGAEQGSIHFRDGQVVEAQLGPIHGEQAVYRALTRNDATFEIELRPVANENVIGRSMEALVMEGMRLASIEMDTSTPSTRLGPGLPTLAGQETRTAEVELDRWLEEPNAPADGESALEHEPIAGVPRRIRPATKRIVVAVLAASAVILVAGGLRAIRARQERLAEESTAHIPSTEPATVKPVVVPFPPPLAPTPANTEAIERDPGLTVAAPIDGAMIALGANATASTTPAVASVAMATPVTAARPASAEGETLIDTKMDPGDQSLVVQANRALVKGDTAHAINLAHQALAANPGDAQAWLTLAAAYQASGNGQAARAAYASCVAQAKTPNITDCHILARQ